MKDSRKSRLGIEWNINRSILYMVSLSLRSLYDKFKRPFNTQWRYLWIWGLYKSYKYKSCISVVDK